MPYFYFYFYFLGSIKGVAFFTFIDSLSLALSTLCILNTCSEILSTSLMNRDGHTHWVLDILPYPIQMFWVISGSSWVESNRIEYGYYPNSSGQVWILSTPYSKKKKKRKKKKLLSLKPPSSPSLSLFLSPEPPWPSTLNSSLRSLAPPLRWSSPSSNQLSQP